jgi:hypothetical protein
MKSKLFKFLTELELVLKEFNYPIINKFNDGKNEEEITEYLDNIKFPNRKDVVELYMWKNGVNGLYQGTNIEQLELFANGIMFSLEFAISMYALEVRVEKKFKKTFLPMFTSGGGDYILMNFDVKSKSYGQLFLYSTSILMTETPMPIYDSLESLFETVLSVYKGKGYYFTEDVFKVDYDIEKKISKQLNPKSDFWKEE